MKLKKFEMKQLLGLTIVPVVIIILFIFRGKIVQGLDIKYLALFPTQATKVDKTDPNWLENYCHTEVKKLPEPPFKFTGLDGDIHDTLPDVELVDLIPKDKFFKAEACALWYKYDKKAAYASIGVEYFFHIDSVNAFEENTDHLITAAIDKSWKKLSPISDEKGGRPGYTYKGFPMIFTRENKALNTVEYATVNFGADELFIHFVAYEK